MNLKNFIKEWGHFLIFISLLLLSRIFLWSPVRVSGHSMDPTLSDGEQLIMVTSNSIERFDIVVVEEDEGKETKNIVKRVVGMPGDIVHYNNDTLYINEEEVYEPYLAEHQKLFKKDKLYKTYSYNDYFQQLAERSVSFTTDDSGNADFTIKVPENHYLLLGDDRIISKDSRQVGTFQKEQIKGEIKVRIWPLNEFSIF